MVVLIDLVFCQVKSEKKKKKENQTFLTGEEVEKLFHGR